MDDIWRVIIGFIDCGSDYKTLCLVDKTWLTIAKAVHPDADTKFANQLLTLLAMIDRGDFVPPAFDNRHNVVWYIRGNTYITHARDIPRTFIDLHPDLFQNWTHLVWPNDTTLQWIEDLAAKYPKEANLIWRKAGSKSCITIDYIKANRHLPWNWTTIAINKNITPEIIDSNPDLHWGIEQVLTWNRNVTLDFAKKHVGSWRWQSHAQIPIADIRNNPDYSWKWAALSSNPRITINDITANLDLPWSWINVFEFHTDIRADHIRKYPQIPWDMHHITGCMRASEVKANQDITWCQCGECKIVQDDSYDFGLLDKGENHLEFAKWLQVRPGMTWKKIMSFPITSQRAWACVFPHAFI